MEFKIRANQEDIMDSKTKYEMYLEYLKQFDMNENKDLWTFFGQDFFHDGSITSFRLSDDMRCLSFRVSCSNIKRIEGNDWVYIDPIWFTCSFEGVVFIQFEAKRLDEYNDPICESESRVCFLQSEINTLSGKIEESNSIFDEEFKSIIIKTLPVQRNFSLVFQSLTVTPDEPLAFELMKHNKSFEVPVFIPEP